MEIDLRAIPANMAGEILRNVFFAQDESHFGCYNTFELRPAVKYLSDEKRRDFDDTYTEVWTRAEYSGIIMAYYWDGDGILEFTLPDGSILLNDDCKKDNRWEWE